MTNNTFDSAKHLRGKDKPAGQPAANKGGFVSMDPNTDAGSDVGAQLTNAALPAHQQANRIELRDLAEDCTDRQGNVHRVDLLNWLDALDEQRADDGAVERAELRSALGTASDDQGNVTREALHSALDAYAAESSVAPFVFDKDRKNKEQVRPYYAAFLIEREHVLADRGFMDISAFRGKIDGIGGPDEDTAIYLLGTMHDLDAMKVNVADFVEAGGVDGETLEPGREYRGTVARYGWYSGGTGWQVSESARAVYYPGHGVRITEKNKRQGYILSGSTMIIVDEPKSKRR